MRWLIRLFGWLLRPVAMRFERALNNPLTTQRSVQQALVDRLVDTAYGQFYGVRSVDDWEKLPIVTYDDLSEWIQDGDVQKLVAEPVLFYETTSGSRGAAKRILYTKSLRRSFSQMFCIWAYDLIQHVPFTTGTVYFCVSPKLISDRELFDYNLVSDPPKSAAAQNPPLQTDADYLDPWLTKILAPFLITLPDAHLPQPPEEFKRKLALRLLQASRLEVISVWNPSFLTILLDYIAKNRSDLLAAIKDPDRRKSLETNPVDWQKLWPQLKLISCWDSVNAAETANKLRSLLPNVLLQGKGLLATEAPMTIPLIPAKGCVPMLTKVFFEFLTDAGDVLLLHDVRLGETYSIVISQKGGLYRYRIGDRVRVTHFYQQTPCLEFVGRDGGVSDLVGEKLNPDFVQAALSDLVLSDSVFSKSIFKTLVPVIDNLFYLLLLDHIECDDKSISHQLDELLKRSHHYAYARALGQLQPPQILCRSDMADRWIQFRSQQGARWGDIKNEVLWPQPIDQATVDRYFSSSIKPTM